MKFLDLFSGIGGFRLGLERSGHMPVGYVEIDKFARQSYQAMYDTTGEWTAEDINKVTDEEWRKFNGTVELIAGGFPCQSFSIAGKREGFLNQTKGTLFFEVARAVKQIKPRFVFLENVKGLLNHDKGNTFRTILNTFDELGYDVEWRIYNSKDFGVPQNRERVYIIGHLRGDSGREVFPFFGEDGEVNPANVKQIGNLSDSNSFGGNPQTGRVYSNDGLSPTLNTMQGGGREPKVMVKEATQKGYDIATVGDSINISQPNSKTRRGRVGHGIANTLVTGSEQATLTNEYRIRKLTPRECWRLQAFPDELFDKAQQAGLSDSQLYKQAGNSVTVNVIEYIGNLLKERE
ncbi:DNA (cytosine-5-)-methyltransferase [Leuconostoc pseudomesenteroides]|uniref:DNA (cytosine-5-)-methyltransferase n=1 Tax=Leuconostoc pseudomesenteroides TaxID=33968 RepID=UPI001123A721|nr:DNA (cytosine-5-)-methyltransferase [Leuconostoc pseudomesenteroides]TOZ06286.1 DNA (cytosine-5-)-methyltransferase [Leuconostoc pseudomesenteroides]